VKRKGLENQIVELNCLVQESYGHMKHFVDGSLELCGEKCKQDADKFIQLIENLSTLFTYLKKKFPRQFTESIESKEQFKQYYERDRKVLSIKLQKNELKEEKFTTINETDIQIHNTLFRAGRGIKGQWNNTQILIKMVKKKDDFEEAIHEAHEQEYLKCPNVVTIYGLCEVELDLYFLTEYTELKYLDFMIYCKPTIQLPVAVKIAMLLDVANGVKCLHAQKPEVLLYNLTSANLLVFPGLRIKICDFGTSNNLLDENSLDTRRNKIWMAPEIILNKDLNKKAKYGNYVELSYDELHKVKKKLYSKECDIWSFGIVMYEIICRCLPYEVVDEDGRKEYEVRETLEKGKIPDIIKAAKINPEYDTLIQLMMNCLAKEKQNRPSFSSIMHSLRNNLREYQRQEIVSEIFRTEQQLRSFIKRERKKKKIIKII
jgi:serine/threonine protein kinase